MDFSNISEAEMNEAKAKFLEANASVSLNSGYGRKASWSDLMDQEMISPREIAQSMQKYGVDIKLRIEDPIIDKGNIAFNHTNARGKTQSFTKEDCYLFLRSALLVRQQDAEYIKNSLKASKLRAFIEDNKSKEEKLEEARKELEILEQGL